MVAFHGLILATFVLVILGIKMISESEIVQAILDLGSRLETTQAALQRTQDDSVRHQAVLVAATFQSGPASPPPASAPATSSLVDARFIGKATIFAGNQEAWADWSFVFRA